MNDRDYYNSMYLFLKNWYDITNSDEIGDLLSLMEPLDDGEPADPSMMDYWNDAVEKIKNGVKIPPKQLS